MMKRILVAGGAGFIGSFLCERLVRDGAKVLCLDNFFTGQEKNIIHLLEERNFQLVRHDICENLDLDIEVDEIYNLACPASPIHYQYDPVKTVKTSVLGTINLLELAFKSGAKILQASTSEVYGDPAEHPQKESYFGHVNPIGVRACYDEGKRCAETLFFDYHRQKKVKIKVARIFNTFGPRIRPDDGRVVSNFITQALQDKPITIYGSGAQTRSFCYVDDLVEGVYQLMQTEDSFTGPVNLGNPTECTITDLASLIVGMTKSKSTIEYRPLPQDDPFRRRPDITLAKEKLAWNPATPLQKGLEKTISYFEKQRIGD